MQHLNDDMDDIFRKAADDYPLNTGTSDWTKVAEGLSQDKDPASPVKKSYRKYTWLLLLLPLAFIFNQIYNPGLFNKTINSNEVGVNTKNSKDQPNLKDSDPGSGKQAPGLENNETGTEKTEAGKDKNETGLDKNESGSDKNVTSLDRNEKGLNKNESGLDKSETNLDISETGSDRNKAVSDKNSTGSDKSIKSDSKIAGDRSSKEQKIPAGQLILSNTRYGKTGNGTSRKNKTTGINLKSSDPRSVWKANERITIRSTVEKSPEADFYGIDPYTKNGLVPFNETPDVSAIPIQEATKLAPGPITKQSPKNKNFYLGLVGGIDMTTISFQQVSKVGHQYGGLAGYSFARKWSVEVGFFVEHKYYYTAPEYFEKGELPYRPNSTVLSVDGSCLMYEIPVSVKYDITNTYKSNFFITGGLSSYIMKNEDYNILYLYNSSGSQAHHSYTYKNSSADLFSQIRITGGYVLKLPKSFSVRIEPYFNIPVSGVGHGDLNLLSGGINAGIFRRIF